MRMEGKVAVVTGGAVGIGNAIAQSLVAEGAYVFITGRRKAHLDQAVEQIGRNIEAVAGDITNAEDRQALFSRIKAHQGKVDVLVLNSGISEYEPLRDLTEDRLDRTFDLNVRAVALTVKEALPLLQPGGVILLIGSIAGYIGTKGYGLYNASKAALRSFARTWANELAEDKIRVNVLSPGPTDTPMFEAVSDEVRKSLTALIPLGRLGRPQEVASAAIFLCSDESSFITGTELSIDGGMAQI